MVRFQLEVCSLESKKLPISHLALENSVFVKEEDHILAWPLLCDPTRRSVDWMHDYLREKNLMTVRFTDLRSQFDTCLAEGLPLLITDVDPLQFVRDSRSTAVIHARAKFVKDRHPFKIPVRRAKSCI